MKLANYVTTNVILGTKSTKRFSDLLFMENKNYQPKLDEETFEKLKNWTGKFIAGNPDIMKLNNHEKFV